MSNKHWIAAFLFVIGLGMQALAQPATLPSADPAISPTTVPAPQVVTVPPGFVPIMVDGIRFLAEPADEPVIRAALKDLGPATLPSTRPADMLERLNASRDQLKQRILTDLALADPAPVDAFLDNVLKNALTTHRDVKPPLVFLVTTEAKLKVLLREGWTDPRFYYNRVADKVEVNWNLNIAMDRPPDEALVPAIFGPDDSPDQRQKKVAASVRGMQERLAEYLSAHAGDDCYNAIMEFLIAQTVEPVRNKLDREWLTTGICGVLTCRYAAVITGRNLDVMLTQISGERPDIPLRQSAVDLVHPIEPSQMRPGAAPLYLIVYTRKSIRVCNEWVAKAGDSAIPKILAEIRKNPPASGAALVEQVKQISGIDLTASLAAGR